MRAIRCHFRLNLRAHTMSESHPEHRSPPAPGDSERSERQSSGPKLQDGDATQTFAYQFSAALSDDASEADSEPTVISNQTPIGPLPTWQPLRPRDLGQLLEGRKLDHFELGEFIGGGGMGAVFRARDTLLSRTVAVKVLAAGAAGNEETHLRFQNEAQSAARLDHPNIARVHYVGEAEGFKYIVFEYLEGKNLRDLVAEVGPLPLEDALNFTLQIAEALAHAWQRDIVHRDIKPSNVLATPEGQVKLVDMGLARLRDVATAVEDLTASGVTLGTFDYISPEQARDPRSADIRSDIYSLGCTLYFMLCGRPPFQGGTAIQKLLMHQADEPPSPREYRPDLPAAVEQLLRRMLAKPPSGRFQNPAELIASIAALADDLGIAVHPTSTVQLTISGQNSGWLVNSLPWLVPAALLIACVFTIDYLDRSTEALPPWNGGSIGDRPLANQASAAPSPPSPVPESDTSPADRVPDDLPSTSGAAPSGLGAGFGRQGNDSGRRDANEPDGPVSPPAAEVDDVGIVAEVESEAPAGGPFSETPAWIVGIPARMAEWFSEMPLRELVRGAAERGAATASGRNSPGLQGSIRNITSDGTFPTLVAAAAAARDGDIIEIATNEPLRIERSSLPIRIEDKEITIRGAAGMWPVLQVVTNAQMGQAGGAGEVFAVEHGRLRLQDIELDLAPHTTYGIPLSGWKVFEIGLGGAVNVTGCWMTISGNASADYDMRNHDNFFHVVGRSAFIESGIPMASDEIQIDLEDVVVRGGDTMVSVEGDSDIDISLENALVAIRGYLYDGGPRFPMDRGGARITLRHVTADLGQGGFRIRGGSSGDDLHATVQNSILLGTPNIALVEHVVEEAPSSDDLPIIWRGRRNIYDDWEFIFRRHVINGTGSPWLFREWQSYWAADSHGEELGSTVDPVPWRVPLEPDVRMAMRVPANYRVDESDSEMQAFLRINGQLPGVVMEELPLRGADRRAPVEAVKDRLFLPPVTEFVNPTNHETGANGRDESAANE